MNRPTVSVMMTNYNYSRYIGEALEAALTQSYPAMEVIVVDDASTDNSVPIIEGFMKKYPNLRLIRNPKNLGVTETVNKGFAACRGDYTACTASDDKMLPGFLERSMGILMDHPQAALCFSDGRVYDEDKNLTLDHKLYLSGSATYFSPNDLERIFSREVYTPIFGPTVVFKRAALIEAGGYLPRLKWSSDAFAHHVAGLRHGVCYVPEVLTVQRVHSRQYSGGLKDRRQEREVIRTIFDLLISPEYSDVMPAFKRTAPISVYPWDVLRVALSRREYRAFISPKLIKYALYDKFIRSPLRSILPTTWVRNIVNSWKRSKCRE